MDKKAKIGCYWCVTRVDSKTSLSGPVFSYTCHHFALTFA